MNKPLLTIVAALNCEAKPWVDLYSLKRSSAEPFALYVSAQADVELVISGVGDIAMASAVGWIGAQSPKRQRVWLNIGTAGHGTYALGTPLRVHGVARSEQGRAHYPPLTAKWVGETSALLSVPNPTNNYPEGAMVDMEAAAFFAVATRFSSSELVQSIKVISDNAEHGFDELNAARITALMVEHTEKVARFAERLCDLVSFARYSTEFEHLLKVKATFSQHQQLAALLRKVEALDVVDSVLALSLDASMPFKELYRAVDRVVSSTVPELGA